MRYDVNDVDVDVYAGGGGCDGDWRYIDVCLKKM